MREPQVDLRDTFPSAAVNTGDTMPQEQRFVIGQATITIITFSKSGTYHAGIVVEGEWIAGYFQRRGYVGAPLKGNKINPIVAVKGIYDLSLDGNVVASFSYRPSQGWENAKI